MSNVQILPFFSSLSVLCTWLLLLQTSGAVSGVGNLSNFSSYFDDTYPQINHHYSGLLKERSFVNDGLVARLGSFNTTEFMPWGVLGSLLIEKTTGNGGVNFFRLNGTNGPNISGFESPDLDYRGKYLTVILGDVIKANGIQISFSFDVTGGKNHYRLILVNGPLSIEGWRNETFYGKMNPHSSQLFDFNRLLGSVNDSYISLTKITIVVQKSASIKNFEFRIDLDKTTENVPGWVEGGNKYFVSGYVNDFPISVEQKYIYQDFKILRSVTLDFKLISNQYVIDNNGWRILHEEQIDTIDGTRLSLVAENALNPIELNTSVPFKLDIVSSLMNLGPKDLLLLTILITSWILLSARIPLIKFKE